jgi:predicted ribosome quality control (RQC) complex YloA/Tae2 family protein
MSFDGLFTRAMMMELQKILTGGRISKIHQPYKNELILIIRSKGKNYKLLLSAHPVYARVQLTDEPHENPKEPPMFCMLLRKHLEGAVIEEIKQKGLDRILILELKGKNEIGDFTAKQLIVEIMGRHSNIVLVDPSTKKIIDSIKHITPAMNRYRTVLPGNEYVYPPAQNKMNPLEATEDDVLRLLDFNSGKLEKQLVQHFSGISPLFAKEVIHAAGIPNRATVPAAFLRLLQPLKEGQFQPTLWKGEEKEHFYWRDLQHLKGVKQPFHSLSTLLDHFYFGKAERDRVKQLGSDLERLVKNELEKNETKLKKLEKTLQEAENADKYQLLGELLTANLYAVQKGMTEIEVINYYDEKGEKVTIPLDPQKSPSGNAQSYFSKYQKAKHAMVVVKEQIDKTKEEIQYFENLLQQLESASPKDLEEIREELAEEGYLRLKSKAKRKQGKDKPIIDTYMASDGTIILVGKNNKQNDYVTTKLARRDDIWLHTKDIPGSHVVIRHTNPSKETLLQAAHLAAYFSKAKHSSSVPVDYTKVRYVKKPNGSKPGFVIYENQQTIYITPDPDVVMKMKK